MSQGDVSTVSAAEGVRDIVGKRELRALMARRDGPALLFLAGHLGIMAGTGVLLWLSLGSLWVIGAAFLHGIVVVHLFAPFHECSHSTTFKTRWMNQALGWFAGLALGLPPLIFKYQHADHHTYTQNIRRDPQMIPVGERLGGYLFYTTTIPYFTEIVRALVRHATRRFSEAELRSMPESAHRGVQLEAWAFWTVYGGLLAGSIALDSWVVALYWLIPRLVGEPVMRIIRMSEHVGCAQNPNMLENSRTIRTLAPIRWLAWNMPHHTAHHAVPLVPFHAIPRLNGLLIDHVTDVRQGYVDAVAYQLRNAWRGGVGQAAPLA
jgi:fatty acid desaturase